MRLRNLAGSRFEHGRGHVLSLMVPPIIVSGHPRSGTSLVCGLLHDAGVWVGDCKPPDHRNPRGYFENAALMRLAKRGEHVTWEQVEPVLRSQGWNGQRWLVKYKPRWLRWAKLDPTFVVVRRSPDAIIASMRKQNPRPLKAIEAKLDRYIDLLGAIPGAHVVWPEKLVAGDDSGFLALFDALGLEWSDRFLDRSLWHH